MKLPFREMKAQLDLRLEEAKQIKSKSKSLGEAIIKAKEEIKNTGRIKDELENRYTQTLISNVGTKAEKEAYEALCTAKTAASRAEERYRALSDAISRADHENQNSLKEIEIGRLTSLCWIEVQKQEIQAIPAPYLCTLKRAYSAALRGGCSEPFSVFTGRMLGPFSPSPEEVRTFQDELSDRYGLLPPKVRTSPLAGVQDPFRLAAKIFRPTPEDAVMEAGDAEEPTPTIGSTEALAVRKGRSIELETPSPDELLGFQDKLLQDQYSPGAPCLDFGL